MDHAGSICVLLDTFSAADPSFVIICGITKLNYSDLLKRLGASRVMLKNQADIDFLVKGFKAQVHWNSTDLPTMKHPISNHSLTW